VPLNPPPTIQASILLVTQPLLRSDMSRIAQLEFCLLCADSLGATYQDAIDDFQANFNTVWGPFFDSEVTMLPPTGRGGDGTDVPLLVVAAGAANVGGNAVATVPPNVALLIKKTTGLGGKRNRGRSYFPFILADASVNENGTITPLTVAAYQVAATAFLGVLNGDLTPMGIENRTFNQPLPPHHVTHISRSVADVTSYGVEPLVATQRRRLGR
jgi:hypothetical protein